MMNSMNSALDSKIKMLLCYIQANVCVKTTPYIKYIQFQIMSTADKLPKDTIKIKI